MVFEDVPLRRVLKELERYRRGRILLLVEGAGRRCGAGEAVIDDGQQPVGIQQADTRPMGRSSSLQCGMSMPRGCVDGRS